MVLGLLGLMPWTRRYFINHILEKNAERVFSQEKFSFYSTELKIKRRLNNKNETIEGEFWED